MDLVKVFVEEPAALGGGSSLPPAPRPADDSFESFMAAMRAPASPYGRAYLAGTRLGGERPVVGLTAIEASAWVEPLMTWAGDRTWTRLATGGRGMGILATEARTALADPRGTLALAIGPGPIPDDILATVVLGEEYAAEALRTLLGADESIALFRPEPAHDGFDWTLIAHSPLRGTLVEAFRACPAPDGVRRLVVPRVRGESKFYFEQWAETLPAGAEEV